MTSTSKNTSASKASAQKIDWRVVALAETHPLRVLILEELRQSDEPCSPNGLAQCLDKPLGNVSYHVKALVEHGFLVLDGMEPRRGAMEHYYRLSEEVIS